MVTTNIKQTVENITMKTIAAILSQLNTPLDIVELNIPSLKYGQVLVKIHKASLCGSQQLEMCGYKNNKKFLPHMMGHEGCGTVLEIGPGITKVKPDDKVVMHWKKGSGIESDFFKYDNVGSGKITTFSTLAVVSENRITKIPNNIDDDFGTLLGCALTTAYGAVIHDSQLQFGDDVLIIGCGGIGLVLIDACLLRGASNLNCYDIKNKHNIIKQNIKFSTQLDNQKRYNIIFDTIGKQETITQSLPLLKPEGKYVIIGQNDPSVPICLNNIPSLFGINGSTIIFSQGGKIQPDFDIPLLCNMWLNQRMGHSHLITHRFNLLNINQAFNVMKNEPCGKIIINMENI
jgi:S-(hydroxymethyl)glutathione dehydrogenase/alcohol dehydrogenase